MSDTAICINCGSPKESWNSRCHNCKFQPHSSADLVESLILSLDLEVQSNDFGNENISTSWPDLLIIGEKIKKKEKIIFSSRDIESAHSQIEGFKSLTPGKIIISLLVFASPIILMIIFLIFVNS